MQGERTEGVALRCRFFDVRTALPLLVTLAAVGWLVWARYRRDGDWRIGPALLAVLAALVTVNEARWVVFENALADAARPVLGATDASFGCERLTRNFLSSTGHAGHVWFDADGTPADTAFLSMDTCAGLKAWRKNPAAADLRTIIAVHTLAHEAAHLTGIRPEAQAECTALTADREVMQRLGATPDQAQHAFDRYLSEVRPRMDGEYVAACPAADQRPVPP